MVLRSIFRQWVVFCWVMSCMNMVKSCIIGVCFFSFVILPLNSQAASFSEMLSSLTKSPSSWDRGEEGVEGSNEKKKRPVPDKKPAWITNREQVSSEQLLDADGNWNVVEKGREYDPAQAHLNARNKVDTARRNKMQELSPHFKPDAKSGQDGKLRVLQIEPDDGVEYDVVEEKIDNKKGSLLSKVFPVFKSNTVSVVDNATMDSNSIKNVSVVIPKIKPKINNVDEVEYKAIMVGGVIVPPAIPERKKSVILRDNDETSGERDKTIASVGFENDVQTSHTVGKSIIPERKPKLIASNSKIMGLKTSLSNTYSSGVEVAVSFEGVPIPTIKPRIKKVVLKNGIASKQGVFVKSLRSGMHPDKTRIVIEMSDVTEYKVTVDDLRNVLRVKLINTKWDISKQDKLKGSVLLGTYIARQSNDDVLLEVRLKEKVKIIGTMVVRPNRSSSHRIVIDLRVL